MSSSTTRLGLKRPDGTDPFLRMDFVNNYNTLDLYPGTFICTSGSRPAWGDAQIGMSVFETDTRREYRFMGGIDWYLVNPIERISGEITMFVSGTIPSGWLLCDGTDRPRSGIYAPLSAAVNDGYGNPSAPNTLATHFKLPNLQSRLPLGGGAGSGLTPRTLGQASGKEKHILDPTEMPVHAHGASTGGAGAHTPTGVTGFDDRRHAHFESGETWRNVAGGPYQAFVNTAQNHGTPGSGGYFSMTTDSVGGSARPATEQNNDFNLHAHGLSMNDVGDHTHPVTVATAGGSGGATLAHENMPPFLVVNFIIKV